jgi:hypothetical protein
MQNPVGVGTPPSGGRKLKGYQGHGRVLTCLDDETSSFARNRATRRQVLECASPLALWGQLAVAARMLKNQGRSMGKRQRAAALHDAGAPTQVLAERGILTQTVSPKRLPERNR